MSGKRLLDALTLVGSSRAVAAHHIAIRREQLDHYLRTSSLRNTINSGLRGSFAKQSRSSASAPHSIQASGSASNPKDDDGRSSHIPSTDSTDHERNRTVALDSQEGLSQDHFYSHSAENSVLGEQSGDDLEVRQKKPARYSFPDGSIPPEDSSLGRQATDSEIVNVRPVDETAAEPVQNSHPLPHRTIQPEASDRSSIPDPGDDGLGSALKNQRNQRQSETQIPSQPAEPPGSDAFKIDSEQSARDQEMSIDQEKDTFYRPSATSSPVLSALPRVKLPRISGDIQASDSHLPNGTNPDTFYNTTGDGHGETTEQKIMQSLFQSPRTAQHFKHGRKSGPVSRIQRSGQAQMSQLARSNRASVTEDSEKAASDARKLGNDLAEELGTTQASVSPRRSHDAWNS